MSEMRCHREVQGRDALYKKLEMRLQQENKWVPNKRRFIALSNGEVSHAERDHAVRGVLNLCKMFNMFPETYAMTVNFLDRFLSLVKARAVHLHCVSLSCLYIAIKLQEEQEFIPDVEQLMAASVQTQLGPPSYQHTDVMRMERKILDKLEWDLNPCTPLIMLEVYFALAVSEGCELLDLKPNDELVNLTEQLEVCLTFQKLCCAKGSSLALAIISLRLQGCGIWTDKLFPFFQSKAHLDLDEYNFIEELTEDVLYGGNQLYDSEEDSRHSPIPVPGTKSHRVSFESPQSSSMSGAMSFSDTSHSIMMAMNQQHCKKPSYADILCKSLNDSMMSMSV